MSEQAKGEILWDYQILLEGGFSLSKRVPAEKGVAGVNKKFGANVNFLENITHRGKYHALYQHFGGSSDQSFPCSLVTD